jgi:glycerol-3-phosphate dehydrogenase subunit B
MSTLALAEAGLRPLLLAKGQGMTHWTGGTIDVWGHTSEPAPRAALQELMRQRPDHPYTHVGLPGIEEAFDRFRALVEAAGYPYVGSLDRNIMLPTALGALRPTAYLPATMAAGDVRQEGDLLIAGFRELRDFFPPLAAANLTAQGIAATGVYLEVPRSYRRLDYTTRTFANLFDKPAFREEIGLQLRDARGSATRIGLPAVLGLRDPLGVVQDLQRISGAQVFEIPTMPPSIPGMRLFNIFRDAITAAGGRMQIGSLVQRASGENGTLTTIASEAAAREQEHRARVFVLATGGIGGGGIRTDYSGKVWETALNLPVQAPASHSEWFASRFLHQEGHPIFTSGVATDAQQRPLDASGSVVYENVVAAGLVLASDDPIQDRCTTGLAITSGWRAGQLAASLLGLSHEEKRA